MKTTQISAAQAATPVCHRRSTPRVHASLLAGLCGLLAAGAAHAQASTTESELRSIDASRRQQELEQAQRQRLLSAPEVRLQEQSPASPRLPVDESPCFRIHAVDLIGPDTVTADGTPRPAELPPGWTPWLLDALDARTDPETSGRAVMARPDADSPLHPLSGICLGSRGVAILQQRAQAALLAHGYITSRALVEAQNLASGRLRLRIVPGRIGDKASDIAWQSASGSGRQDESTQYNKIDGQLTLNAAQLNVQGSAATLQQAATALAQQPGLEWLGQLQSDPALATKVDWQKINEAHKDWQYNQQGLTPAGAAIITLVVALFTAGAGTAAAGSAGTAGAGAGAAGVAGTATTATAATASGATWAGAYGAAMTAAQGVLMSQAAITMINTGGNIGDTLKQMSSKDSVRALITAMVTAGAINALGNTVSYSGSGGSIPPGQLGTTQVANDFTGNLLRNITNNLASATIDAAINGKPLNAETLADSLKSALITAGMAQGANSIGDAQVTGDLNAFTHKVAHAILGCAAGAAMESGNCATGAVGGVVGELAAEFYNPTGTGSKAQTEAFAKLMAGVAGAMVSGDGNDAGVVNVAAATGGNAAANNYLSPKQNLARKTAQAACDKDPTSDACTTAAKLNVLDQRTDKALAQVAAACTPNNMSACRDLVRMVNQLDAQGQAELQTMMNELGPSCAPPRDCTQAANWTQNELQSLYRWKEQVWPVMASGHTTPTVGPEAVLAGGALAALRLSAMGFTAGAGFDATGQYLHNGTVRPEQTFVAGLTGALGLPVAARGNLWVPTAGAGAAAANTTFNNWYYDEDTSVLAAMGLGSIFGAVAPAAARSASNSLTPWLTQTPRITVNGAAPTFPVKPRWPALPNQINTGIETTVSNLPSFIPLDNGKQEKK